MSNYLEKLLSNSTESLNSVAPSLSLELTGQAGVLADELLEMLSTRNGFYALESALHIFPSHSTESDIGLDEWNSESLWRSEYKEMLGNCLFFAEDLFGSQFCIKDNKVFTFDPETGEFEYLAENIEGWAQAIIEDYNALTGYPLAHEWQQNNGVLPSNKRLLPRIPFVAGGEFTLENLYLGSSVEGMQFRASIANQIKDLPNGAQIQFNVVD